MAPVPTLLKRRRFRTAKPFTWDSLWQFFSAIYDRQRADHVIYLASSLAYFSLLALVPVLAISLSVFASFIDQEEQDQIFELIVDYAFPFDEELLVVQAVVPGATGEGGEDSGISRFANFFFPVKVVEGGEGGGGEALSGIPFSASEVMVSAAPRSLSEVREKFTATMSDFVAQTRGLGMIGFVLFIITGFWLFDSIEDAFNSIWRTDKRRPFLRRFTVFWVVSTLAPILMVGPLVFNRYLDARDIPQFVDWIVGVLSFLLTWFAVFLLYMLVPNARVARRAAVSSALLVAIFWEISKQLFALYVASGQTYQTVYGGLSTVLFVLGWIYYTWLLILLGLEVCSYIQFPDWEKQSAFGDFAPELGLLYSWGGLFHTGKNYLAGKGGTPTESISAALGLDRVRVARILEHLEEAGVLIRDREGGWYPAVPLEKITWADVAQRLDYDLEESSVTLSDWFDSALRARGLVGFRQETEDLPDLDALLKRAPEESRLDKPVLSEALLEDLPEAEAAPTADSTVDAAATSDPSGE